MSWSVSIAGTPAEDFDAALDDLALPQHGGLATNPPEWEEQLAAAKRATKLLVKSGALGKGGSFHATLTGHANPGHNPTAGWANDHLTITVSRTPPPESPSGPSEASGASGPSATR